MQGLLKGGEKTHKPETHSLYPIEGFDHVQPLFRCALQQSDLEDVNFCLTSVILIMEMLPK